MTTERAHWEDVHTQQLRELWRTPMRQGAIARQLGFSAAYISIKAKAMELPPRGKRRRIPDSVYLQEEAALRNITARRLMDQIIDIVLQDKLITAILDDGDGQ